MAAVAVSRRSLIGIAFIVGGALIAVAALVGLAASPGPEAARVLSLIGDLAIAAGFVLLALEVVALPTRIAFIVAAAGWLLLALDRKSTRLNSSHS